MKILCAHCYLLTMLKAKLAASTPELSSFNALIHHYSLQISVLQHTHTHWVPYKDCGPVLLLCFPYICPPMKTPLMMTSFFSHLDAHPLLLCAPNLHKQVPAADGCQPPAPLPDRLAVLHGPLPVQVICPSGSHADLAQLPAVPGMEDVEGPCEAYGAGTAAGGQP